MLMFNSTCVQKSADSDACGQNRHFDVALVDLNLADASGVDVISRLVKRQLLVIGMSGVDPEVGRLLSLDNGAIDFLAKPIDFSKLQLILQNATKPDGHTPG